MQPQLFAFTDGFGSVDDIAEYVIEACCDAQGVSRDELEVVPVQAIDEDAMDRALTTSSTAPNDWNDDLQREWDLLRDAIAASVESKCSATVS
jgi:hypothetical protein